MGCRYSAPMDVMDTANDRGRPPDESNTNNSTNIDRSALDQLDTTFLSLADIAGMDDYRTHRRHRRRRRRGRRELSNEERLAEIAALQQSLTVMEGFFQNLVGQAQIYMEAMDPNNTIGGPPPASDAAIASLIRSSLTSKELGKSCSICCEVYSKSQIVIRLPCGHFYHSECVEPWLHRHCTCPSCRYELVTDDEQYEVGRIQRMKLREKLPCFINQDNNNDDSCSSSSSSTSSQTSTWSDYSLEEQVHMMEELQAAVWCEDFGGSQDPWYIDETSGIRRSNAQENLPSLWNENSGCVVRVLDENEQDSSSASSSLPFFSSSNTSQANDDNEEDQQDDRIVTTSTSIEQGDATTNEQVASSMRQHEDAAVVEDYGLDSSTESEASYRQNEDNNLDDDYSLESTDTESH